MKNNTQKVHESFAEFTQWMDNLLIEQGWKKCASSYSIPGGNQYVLWNHPRGTKCDVSLSGDAGYMSLGIPGNRYPNLDNPSSKLLQNQLRQMVQSVMGVRGGSYTRRVDEFNHAHPELDWWH